MQDTINNRALLVNLSIRTWSGRKFDRAASRDFTSQKHAPDEAARVNKLLIPAADLKPVNRACNATRTINYQQTLPYMDGLRLLPLANYQRYLDTIGPRIDEAQTEINRFLLRYPSLVEHAPERMAGLYLYSDYPAPETIRERFSVGFELLPLPSIGPLQNLFNVSDSEKASIMASAEKALQEKVDAAQADAARRLREAVQLLAVALADKNKIFKNSKTGNIADLIDLLPRLNINNDAALTDCINQARGLVRYDAQQLRENETARANVATEADALLEKMAAFL